MRNHWGAGRKFAPAVATMGIPEGALGRRGERRVLATEERCWTIGVY